MASVQAAKFAASRFAHRLIRFVQFQGRRLPIGQP